MANPGTYGAGREVFPAANTVACFFTEIADRDAIFMYFQTYSTDLYDTAGHPDDQQWLGWEPFCQNCGNLIHYISTQIPPPGSEFIDGWQAAQQLGDFYSKYRMYDFMGGSATGIPEVVDTVSDAATKAWDWAKDEASKLKDAADTAKKVAPWVIAAVAAGGIYLLYTWSKAGGKVAVV